MLSAPGSPAAECVDGQEVGRGRMSGFANPQGQKQAASLDLVQLAMPRLPAYLMRQRWYPAKDGGVPQVSLVASMPFPAGDRQAVVAIWQAEIGGRPPVRFFLPLVVFERSAATSDLTVIADLPDRLALVDATVSDDFIRAWVRQMMTGTPGADAGGLMACNTPAIRTALSEAADWPVRRGTAEQSNTSIRIGQDAILKIIRTLEPGVHPELEMNRFLNGPGKFEAVPALLGWAEFAGMTISVLQGFVANQGDGWSWLLAAFRNHRQDDEAVRRWIARLGQRTAQMHNALDIETSDPDFQPRLATREDTDRWSGDLDRRLRQVAGMISPAGSSLDDNARRLADALLERQAEIMATANAWLAHAMPVRLTRHHGDFHLGQVLVAGDDAVIVDFEGEPLRSLAERRAKQAPVRDVAGMLRSFAYAAATAAQDSGDAEGARAWQARAEKLFLDAYLGTLRQAPDRGVFDNQLRFFLLEKALYEVVYEAGNRPAWIAIPLQGVFDVLTPSEGEDGSCRRSHAMPHGAEIQPDGGVRFRLWAPSAESIEVELDGTSKLPMNAQPDGWFELVSNEAKAGTRYRYLLPDGMKVPDPASRFQPEDVAGPSEVVSPLAHVWHDTGWRGRPWSDAVIYELHVGAFTAAGTFRAAINRLDHLVELGVTAIEIMPIADFSGLRNWGYDGVLLYAPDSSYGRPEDLKALVEAAHARNIMVLLDVVYNHFGPEGNYLPVYARAFFTERHHTPWGAAINYDGDNGRPVRDFVIHNALYWLEEFHLDGLRLDAVHTIVDDSTTHLLDELSTTVRQRFPDRPIHLILENEENDSRLLARNPNGEPDEFTAQWNDDVHHVLHVAATGEGSGYYGEYLGDTAKLGRALAEGFAFQGETMEFRGAARGKPSAHLPPGAFVAFIQNHDQIGNRAFGDRIGTIATKQAVRAIAATCLLLPQTPMLFMGEEWNTSRPFPFFCDFHGELAEAVRKGRRAEFSRFPEFSSPEKQAAIPDPQAEQTFASAKLDWDNLGNPENVEWLDWYRSILAVRHQAIRPLLEGAISQGGTFEVLGDGAVVVRWAAGDSHLTLAANLSAQNGAGFPPPGNILWQEGEFEPDGSARPWAVRWTLEPR